MSALQSALAELRTSADTGSSAGLLADECAALTAEIDRLTARLAEATGGMNNAMSGWQQEAEALESERDDLRARIGRAHAELRRQHLRADHTLHPDVSAPVMAALEAVETHLVDPEHRAAEPGAEP